MKGAAGEDPTITIAFDNVAEFPLEPVLSFVLASGVSATGDADFFFATPNGLNQAHIDEAVCETLRMPGEEAAHNVDSSGAEPPSIVAEAIAAIDLSSKRSSPTLVKPELLSTGDAREHPGSIDGHGNGSRNGNGSSSDLPYGASSATGSNGVHADELSRALKRVR